MRSRIRRINPFQSAQNNREVIGNLSNVNTISKLTNVEDLLFSGKALLERIDEYHQVPAPNPFQEIWNRFRLSIVAAGALPGIQFLVSGMPVPDLELVDQFFIQNVIIRLVSILDDKLEEIIENKALPIAKNPRLADRIDAVRDSGLITNDTAINLHSLRQSRNDLGHDVNPPVFDFSAVFSAANNVEQAFLELGVITKSPEFKVENMTFEHFEPSERQYELGRREALLSISVDGSPFCTFRWTYVYFSDPAWMP